LRARLYNFSDRLAMLGWKEEYDGVWTLAHILKTRQHSFFPFRWPSLPPFLPLSLLPSLPPSLPCSQGVYIVTQEEIVRLDMDASSASLKFRWATTYGRGGLPVRGGRDKEGGRGNTTRA